MAVVLGEKNTRFKKCLAVFTIAVQRRCGLDSVLQGQSWLWGKWGKGTKHSRKGEGFNRGKVQR